MKIIARPMAKKSDRVIKKIGDAWALWIALGKGQVYPLSMGVPDVGPRGGQAA